MSEPVVTISGQRVYPRGQAPKGTDTERPDASDPAQHAVALTEMSPSGWGSSRNEETFQASLPFLGAIIGLILIAVAAVLIARRR